MIREPLIGRPEFLRTDTNPTYIIAEIGGNHGGNFDLARKQLQLAVEANVDAVKFQIYEGEKLVSSKENNERVKHYRKRELSQENVVELAGLCMDNDVDFIASVWDEDNLEWANKLVQFHKIGSGDLTAFPLIEKFVDTGKPILLSTGLSTVQEIERTVQFIESIDPKYISDNKLALLQCTSSYPTPKSEVNLNSIEYLEEKFELPIGYSDHTRGIEASYLAYLSGAQVIEMHFTDKRQGRSYRDHKLSVKKDEVIELTDRMRQADQLLGHHEKKVTNSEINSGQVHSFRRGLYAKQEIKAGKTLTSEDIISLRPEVGIPAWKYEEVIGKKIINDREKNEPISKTDLQL